MPNGLFLIIFIIYLYKFTYIPFVLYIYIYIASIVNECRNLSKILSLFIVSMEGNFRCRYAVREEEYRSPISRDEIERCAACIER